MDDILIDEAIASTRLDGETFTIDPRPLAWIFDLDGTLFKIDPDWETRQNLRQAQPIEAVLDVALTLKRVGQQLLFVTARFDDCRAATIEQLQNHYLLDRWGNAATEDPHLYMRDSAATYQPLDYEYKEQVYQNQIKPNWNVRGVFEDDEDCASTWQAEGLDVFQIRNGKV
jgi:FMN phosphatase YigB (HAD superfamily)